VSDKAAIALKEGSSLLILWLLTLSPLRDVIRYIIEKLVVNSSSSNRLFLCPVDTGIFRELIGGKIWILPALVVPASVPVSVVLFVVNDFWRRADCCVSS